ncbi:MAG: hypothetical protein ACT4ON_03225 [Bacteroidota bacterium]
MKILGSYRIIGYCLIILIGMLAFSCTKEGTGGKSTVSGFVMHHSERIPNSTVYIKYGATEFPGTNTADYDASVATGGDAHYVFTNLRDGDYYLYGVGYDNTISQEVMGGVAVKLKYDKTTKSDVPVTE